jgi:hypothetical protein
MYIKDTAFAIGVRYGSSSGPGRRGGGLGRASLAKMMMSWSWCKTTGKHEAEGTKKGSSSAGKVAAWLLLSPLLVLVVLKTDFLPTVSRTDTGELYM